MARKSRRSIIGTIFTSALVGVLGYAVGVYFGIPGGFVTKMKAPIAASEEPAPSFSFPDLKGRETRLLDFRGKVVLVDFWATWCAPCLEELPVMKEVYGLYQDKGFEIVGVSIDEGDKSEVASYVRQYRVPYPIVMAGGLDAIPEGFQVRAIPTAYLLDRQGNIRRKFVGYKFKEELSKSIEKLLEEK